MPGDVIQAQHRYKQFTKVMYIHPQSREIPERLDLEFQHTKALNTTLRVRRTPIYPVFHLRCGLELVKTILLASC